MGTRTTSVFHLDATVETTLPRITGASVVSGVFPELKSQYPAPESVSRVPVSNPVIETPRSTAFCPLGLKKTKCPESTPTCHRPGVVSSATPPSVPGAGPVPVPEEPPPEEAPPLLAAAPLLVPPPLPPAPPLLEPAPWPPPLEPPSSPPDPVAPAPDTPVDP